MVLYLEISVDFVVDRHWIDVLRRAIPGRLPAASGIRDVPTRGRRLLSLQRIPAVSFFGRPQKGIAREGGNPQETGRRWENVIQYREDANPTPSKHTYQRPTPNPPTTCLGAAAAHLNRPVGTSSRVVIAGTFPMPPYLLLP